jgi:hypothetical protein
MDFVTTNATATYADFPHPRIFEREPLKNHTITIPASLELAKFIINFDKFIEDSPEGMEKTRNLIEVISMRADDCSLKSFGSTILDYFKQQGVWPMKFKNGKEVPLGIVKSRKSLAGRLYNRMYSLASQFGVVLDDKTTGRQYIKIFGRKELQKLAVAYIDLNPDFSTVEAVDMISKMTPIERGHILDRYIAKRSSKAL